MLSRCTNYKQYIKPRVFISYHRFLSYTKLHNLQLSQIDFKWFMLCLLFKYIGLSFGIGIFWSADEVNFLKVFHKKVHLVTVYTYDDFLYWKIIILKSVLTISDDTKDPTYTHLISLAQMRKIGNSLVFLWYLKSY